MNYLFYIICALSLFKIVELVLFFCSLSSYKIQKSKFTSVELEEIPQNIEIQFQTTREDLEKIGFDYHFSYKSNDIIKNRKDKWTLVFP